MAKDKLYRTKLAKYNGIKIDQKFTWMDHINDIATAINFNAMLFKAMLIKVREFVNTKILKQIYYTIIDCHLNYATTLSGLNKNSLNRLIILQKRGSAL